MRYSFPLALALLAQSLLALPAPGRAAPVLDRVRQDGVVRCAGVVRPGLAFPARDGAWHGLEVDLCRAVAVAALGPAGRSEFRSLYAPGSYDALRRGEDDVLFMTLQEMAAQHLTGDVLPGTPVFYEPERVLVPAGSDAKGVADLAGKMVCFEPGTRADHDLDALVAARAMHVFYGPFFEADEMLDAFNVGRCAAIVGEATSLAALKFSVDETKQPVRLLPEALSVAPVFAATPAAADGRWAQVVAWTVQTVIAGGMSGNGPMLAPELGLDRGWQARVIAEVGTYADLYGRALGDLSPLGLPRGVNASPAEGGLLEAPLAQ